MDEREEARVIASVMRCSIRFEDSHVAVLSYPGSSESCRVVRRGACWRSLLDLSRAMAAERLRENLGEGRA